MPDPAANVDPLAGHAKFKINLPQGAKTAWVFMVVHQNNWGSDLRQFPRIVLRKVRESENGQIDVLNGAPEGFIGPAENDGTNSAHYGLVAVCVQSNRPLDEYKFVCLGFSPNRGDFPLELGGFGYFPKAKD